MVFAAYLLENAILVLSWGGAFAPYFSLYRRFLYECPAPPGVHLQLFQNKMTKCPTNVQGGIRIDWAIKYDSLNSEVPTGLWVKHS